MKWISSFVILFTFVFTSSAQVNYNANDVVPEYNDYFRPGVNPGVYQSWTDEQLANLAAGNPYLSIPGIGAKSIRPTLPEFFLDTYGYDVRLGAFSFYKELGMEQNVCFIGYPNLVHRDTNIYCQGQSISELFANMYEPIWDGGANGTPYNDDNYLAAYTYEVVTMYKDYVRFWEIWNEPSLDQSNFKATLPPGHPDSWWVNDPDPCDMDIQAPVYHYIRMLRVCYDVIKTVDPEAYVTLGGVGYNSFFDVLCRNTDNPVDGSVTPEYPLGGGAYFDAVGIHTYPHFDGSTIFIDNGQLVFERHSDAAADGVVLAKNGRQAVLDSYGYDGITYPKKKYLITEINIPRLKFDDFIGSVAAQRNFITKALLTAMSNEIHQLHIYNLGDIESGANVDSWFDVMGLYGNLNETPPYTQEPTEAGIAFKTAADMMFKTEWDPIRSANLNLPPNIRGGAIKKENGEYIYVLWAKTQIDESEVASAVYNFPSSFNISTVYKKEWDYSETLFEQSMSSQNIVLNATPAFFTTTPAVIDNTNLDISECVETIDGFTYMGQFLGSKYFRSTSSLTWEEAKVFCEERGGNLAEISNFAENDFIKNNIAEAAFIGLSDSGTEGVLEWSNGSGFNFNNICDNCAPNTSANDYLMIHNWDGQWSYNPSFVAKKFIMEFDCFNDTVPVNTGGGGSDCDAAVPGFTSIGELGGKQYFISNGANNWSDSKLLAEAQGGDLIVIDDAVENLFIQGKINSMVHIGLTDGAQEGILKWVNGSSLSYQNLDPCNFCGANTSTNDNLVMHPWNGGWSFASPFQNFHSIMERECQDNGGGNSGGGSGNCTTNFALNANATQSSTQLNASASRAIDGNTDGNFWASNSTSLTNWTSQPWLEIDLGSVKNIDKIEIWNRDDCCENIFSNYYVFVSNNPFTSSNLNATLSQSGITSYFHTEEAARPTIETVNQTGRYIRIQLTGTSFLAVTEVKVLGCENTGGCPTAGTSCNDGNPLTINDVENGSCNCAGIPDVGDSGCISTTNLALGQPTTQSSTLSVGGITGESNKAVDGNTNGAYFISPASISSVTATLNESQPYWQVDLEASYLLETINLFNRTDGSDRTQNCYVLISNNAFTSTDLAGARAEASYEYHISGLVGSPSVINPNIEGRYIRVQMASSGHLVIAELEALGCVAPPQNFAVPNLLTFNAKKKGQEAEIDWLMFKDNYVDFYEVEVSQDGVNFELLNMIASSGIPTSRSYQIIDNKPFTGENFYRLKVNQKDGSIYYSYPRLLNFDIKFEEIFVYPNPTSDIINMSLRDFAGQQGTMDIYNSFGQKVLSRNYQSFPSQAIVIDVNNYVSGVYSIVVKVDNYRSFTKKFVVSKL